MTNFEHLTQHFPQQLQQLFQKLEHLTRQILQQPQRLQGSLNPADAGSTQGRPCRDMLACTARSLAALVAMQHGTRVGPPWWKRNQLRSMRLLC